MPLTDVQIRAAKAGPKVIKLSDGGGLQLRVMAKGRSRKHERRLRRWLPRDIDIDQISDEDIQDIVFTANLTPRKCLGFKTPFQALLRELGKEVQIRFS